MSAADYFNIQNKALGFDYYEEEQYKTGNPFGHPELQTINAPEYQIPDEALVTPKPRTQTEQPVQQDTDLIKKIGIGVGTTLLLAGSILAGPKVFNVARKGLARFGGRGTMGGRILERTMGGGQATGLIGRERIIEEAIRPTVARAVAPAVAPTVAPAVAESELLGAAAESSSFARFAPKTRSSMPLWRPESAPSFASMEARLAREGQRIGAADVEFMRTQRDDWNLYNTFNAELDEIEASLPSQRITGLNI
tara:strand:- start:37 stop:792 length:756 start_codon:yes stop_codon:yes gene_type:complete